MFSERLRFLVYDAEQNYEMSTQCDTKLSGLDYKVREKNLILMTGAV